MLTDFSTELSTWKDILRLRKGTIIFFSLVTILLVSLFLVMSWEYRLFETQVSQLTSQVEVIAELDEDLPEDQQDLIREEIAGWGMVTDVELWSAERSAQYIDQQILSGYVSFLKKNQLEIPVQPLLRIQLSELGEKKEVEEILKERFRNQILVIDSSEVYGDESFAGEFIGRLMKSTDVFQWVIILVLICLLAASGYLTSFMLSERSRGFHLKQLLHISAPYDFWPAFLVSGSLSLGLCLLGMVLASFFLGHVLLLSTLLLFGLMLMLDAVLCWFGRYVVIKWGMR